jgi:hypothetical protein
MAANKFLREYFNRKPASQTSASSKNRFYLKKWKPLEAGEWVVFIPAKYKDPVTGEDLPWYQQYEASLPRQSSTGKTYYANVACSCFDHEIAAPCALHEYDQFTQMLAATNDPRSAKYPRIPIKRIFYINVLRLGYFHYVDEEYTRTDGGKATRKILVECTSKDPNGSAKCPYCKAGTERHFGDLRYLRAGTGYMDSLVSIMHDVESHCACGGSLYPVTAKCPSCKAEIADLEAVPETVRESVWKEKISCERCGYIGVPILEHKCTKCNNPTPLSYDDTALKVGTVTSGKFRVLTLKDIGGGFEEFIPRTYGDKALEEFLKLSETPLDFPKEVAMTYEQQLEILGIDAAVLKAGVDTNPLED